MRINIFKTYLYLSFLGLLVSCSGEEIDSVNSDCLTILDINFETLLIEKGIDSDGVINQKILKKDAKVVKRLDLEFSSNTVIKDLTGIEGFVNLTLLAATSHEIAQIDLSKNVKLDSVYLAGNYLQSIDVSNNVDLVLLNISVNELSSIVGLSELLLLRKLDLTWNNLAYLNIQNEALKIVFLDHNLLRSLNTDNATSLTNITLNSNKLISVDFDKNALLETLVISDNKLQSIILDKHNRLTHLYISSNSLKSLDVSNLGSLEDLKVNRNPDLSCVKIQNGQEIPYLTVSDYQILSANCNN